MKRGKAIFVKYKIFAEMFVVAVHSGIAYAAVAVKINEVEKCRKDEAFRKV